MESSDIHELPELPITVSLLRLMMDLIELFRDDGYLDLAGQGPWLPSGAEEHTWQVIASTFARTVRDFIDIRPDVFFRNDTQKKSTGSCPTAAELPLDARIESISNDLVEQSFPYVSERLGTGEDTADAVHMSEELSGMFVKVSNGSSVNINCCADDVHISLPQARRIARAVSVGLNWTRARLLFIGAAEGREGLGKLPLGVIRLVASFLIVPF